MSLRRRAIASLILVVILAAGCAPAGPANTSVPSTPASPATATRPTDTPLPIDTPLPTDTPVPPTKTPQPTATPLPPLTGSGGGRIAFSSRRGEGDYEVYVMNADGSDKRQVTHDIYESENPIWSPDGTQIAYNLDNYAGRCDIWVINADGSNKRQLTTDGNSGSLTWSPDGTRIAFARHIDRSGGDSDLYVMAVPSGTGTGGVNEQPLTRTGSDAGIHRPVWSPDGTQIACVVDMDPDPIDWESTICLFDVQDALQKGGAIVADMRPLPRVGECFNDWPAWSPAGSQIVFSAVVGYHRDLYVVNVDGTGLRQLTDTLDWDEYAPAWSPDGTQIVFQANPEAQWDIYVINADGTDLRRLTTDPANDTAPDWAP